MDCLKGKEGAEGICCITESDEVLGESTNIGIEEDLLDKEGF